MQSHQKLLLVILFNFNPFIEVEEEAEDEAHLKNKIDHYKMEFAEKTTQMKSL